jgi:oligopeptide transport system ATP-binding protein
VTILEVKDLTVRFKTLNGVLTAVDNISFDVKKGEILGIVGESGSGKSQSVLAILGLLANNATASGSIKYLEEEILNLNEKSLNKIRGNKIVMIFQDPMTSLNPYLTIKSQIIEVLVLHKGLSKTDATVDAIKMLDFVKIRDAKNTINQYPHELSGGMRQRVMIATALLCKPDLIIADEPTTALDVTVQAQILQILKELRQEFNSSIIMITHDMGVVSAICDRVNIMYAGSIMESGCVSDVFKSPLHPYTKALLDSIPDITKKVDRLKTIPGEVPNLMQLPTGCKFQDRCSFVHEECRYGDITLKLNSNSRRLVKCNLGTILE